MCLSKQIANDKALLSLVAYTLFTTAATRYSAGPYLLLLWNDNGYPVNCNDNSLDCLILPVVVKRARFRHLYYRGSSTTEVPVLYRHLYYIGTCTIYAPVLYRHLYYIDTCTIYTPVLYRHLYYIDTCTIYTPVLYRHLYYIDTCAIYTPVLYRHLYYVD